MASSCCPVMDLQWTPRVVDNQLADVQFCASCGQVHRTEKYAICLEFPRLDRCVNCGGALHLTGPHHGNGPPPPHLIKCSQCGMTSEEDFKLHRELASIHPEGDFLAASEALLEAGRYVLALKLATAETRWGSDPVEGELMRLGVLDAVGEVERALLEAMEWADMPGAPIAVHGAIAELRAATGDYQGAVISLEKGLDFDPERYDWWLDLAELLLTMDDRSNAVRAASKAIKSTENEARSVALIAEIGERYYAAGQYAEALSVCSMAKDRQEHHVSLCWLRARIAATNQDPDYLVEWLKATLALDPDHVQAKEMLEPYERRRGWFPF